MGEGSEARKYDARGSWRKRLAGLSRHHPGQSPDRSITGSERRKGGTGRMSGRENLVFDVVMT